MKKYIVSILVASVFLIGIPFLTQTAQASNLNIRDFINLLITIGVITQDKMPAVNAYLASLDNSKSTIYPSELVIQSGEIAKLTLTYPIGIIRSELSFTCPSKISMGTSSKSCSKYIDVTSKNDFSSIFVNSDLNDKTIKANYITYTQKGKKSESSANITVLSTSTQPYLAVSNQGSGENWITGKPQSINWITNKGSGNVGVYISKATDGVACLLGQSPINSRNIVVTPVIGQICPNQNVILSAGVYYLFFTYPFNGSTNPGGSMGDSLGRSIPITLNDSLYNRITISQIYPLGGVYRTGDNLDIYWNSAGLENVSAILISEDNSNRQYPMFSDVKNIGSNYWVIPNDIPSGHYRISIGYGTLSSLSDIISIYKSY